MVSTASALGVCSPATPRDGPAGPVAARSWPLDMLPPSWPSVMLPKPTLAGAATTLPEASLAAVFRALSTALAAHPAKGRWCGKLDPDIQFLRNLLPAAQLCQAA